MNDEKGGDKLGIIYPGAVTSLSISQTDDGGFDDDEDDSSECGYMDPETMNRMAIEMAKNIDQQMMEEIYNSPNPPTINITVANSIGKSESNTPCSLSKTPRELRFPTETTWGHCPPFEGPIVGFKDADKNIWLDGIAPFPTLPAKDPIRILPEKGWHNQLVTWCDTASKNVTICVSSGEQLEPVREMARRLRRPDIMFAVAPKMPESDEIEKI